MPDLSQQFDMYPSQIADWKGQLQGRVAQVFIWRRRYCRGGNLPKALYAKIGQLALENAITEMRAHQARPAEREPIIDRNHDLRMSKLKRLFATPLPPSCCHLAL